MQNNFFRFIGVSLFALPSVVLLVLGMLPVGMQVLRGAGENPDKVLHSVNGAESEITTCECTVGSDG